jgi:L-asparaginase II
MTNPILVEVTRGEAVESVHRGALAICDDQGETILSVGDIAASVFPRSAIKLIQALPLVEEGAADAYGFATKELALACASHNGERLQVETARAMLAAAGLSEDALECGAHPPRLDKDVAALHRAGELPRRVHNNCSGKHAGMLALARHRGIAHVGYSQADHPVQRAVAEAMADLTGADLLAAPCGTDGCSIPTYAVPLSGLATAFARLASGAGLAPRRAEAARRLLEACFAEPFMTAGTGRFCTEAMAALGHRAYVKTGAEGVYCAVLPERGWGIALKCDDGATRASEAMMAELLIGLLDPDAGERRVLERFAAADITNWAGQGVGQVRATSALRQALRSIG